MPTNKQPKKIVVREKPATAPLSRPMVIVPPKKPIAASESTEVESPPMTSDEDDPILNYSAAGKRVGRHRSTVQRWAAAKAFPIVMHPSGAPGVRQSVLDAFYEIAKRAFDKENPG